MILKANVRLLGLRPEMLIGHLVVADVFARHEVDLVVTSVCDGRHSRNSLHYTGCAIDYRTRHTDRLTLRAAELALRQRLTKEFDVVLEDVDGPNEHLHVEYQPEGP